MPDPASVDAETWREYWLNWPLAAWTGQLRGSSNGWFRIDGRRFLPAFQVATDVGDTFDAMVEELVDYRLARYLFTKAQPAGRGLPAQGHPGPWSADPHARP